MSVPQTDKVITSIIKEIVKECAARGNVNVSETLVAFMLKAVILDPKNCCNTEIPLTTMEVKRLMQICINRLLETQSPSLDTIKMQIFFEMNYTTRSEFLEEHKRIQESRFLPVLRDITDRIVRTEQEYQRVYREIVCAIVLRSGLGSATDVNVLREATASLQSVFPPEELAAFVLMKKDRKEQNIREFADIVTGIRLFNKDSGKGGEGIDDLPGFLNDVIPKTHETIKADFEKLDQLLYKYKSTVEKLDSKQGDQLSEDDRNARNLLIEAIINCRQQEIMLAVLLEDSMKAAEHVNSLLLDFNKRMNHIRQTIQNKHAVPTAQVYPQFVQLAECWTGFQEEVVLLSVVTSILNSLGWFSKTHMALFPDNVLTQWIDVTQMNNKKECDGEKVDPDEFPEYLWIFPQPYELKTMKLEFRGYCGMTLVKHDRLVMPGNTNVGILFYRGKNYAFASRQAAEEFMEGPELFLRAVVDCARRSPELIDLFDLHHHFTSLAEFVHMVRPTLKDDVACQTDTHFMESNIVKSYEWNEWELRRQALRWANLKRKVTHSMQTHLSNWRRDNVSQVYLPYEQETQTDRDNYSNVTKPSVFNDGLLGAGVYERTNYQKVDLTIPVEQQLMGKNNGKCSSF